MIVNTPTLINPYQKSDSVKSLKGENDEAEDYNGIGSFKTVC